MRPDVKLLYDVMADTNIQVQLTAARLQLARVHALRARFARDEIINSPREESNRRVKGINV